MADEVIQKSSTEVIGLDGKTQDVNNSDLAGIFDKIEAGKAEGKTAEETLKTPEVPDKKEEVKPELKEEVKEEVKQEVKTGLDAQLTDDQKKKEVVVEDKKDELPDEELQPKETDKPKTQLRIKQLWAKVKQWETVATTTQKERDEKAQKLSELEKKLTEVKTVDPKTEEENQKRLEELSMFRRRYELDNDPELKTKFDARVASAEDSIVQVLKKRNAGEALLNLVKEEGGWNKFSESSRLITIPDGEGDTKQVTTAELADAILSKLPLGERKSVEAAMMEQVQTKRDRERYFKEQQDKALEYFKKRDEEAQQGSLQQKKQIEEATKIVGDWRKNLDNSDWLKDKPIPEGASAADKKDIEEHNKANKDIKARVDKAIAAKDLPEVLEIYQEAARYHDEKRVTAFLKRENEKLKAELKAKLDEMAKFKNGSRTTAKSGSISTSPTHVSDNNKKPLTLEEEFEAIARGRGRGDD